MGKTHEYTKKSVKNALISMMTQLLTNVLGFVSRSVFIRCLSAEYLGINGLFANVLTLLSFAELGIGEALVYAMYKPMKENDDQKLKALLSYYKRAYQWIAGGILTIGCILSFFIDSFVSQKPEIPENFQIIFFLFLLNNVMSYCMVYKQSILMVDQNKYIVSLIRQVIYGGQLLLQTIVLLYTKNYYIYLVCQIIGTVATNFSLSKYVDRHYPWTQRLSITEQINVEERMQIFKDVKALSISKVAGVVSNGSDNIIIAKLVSLVSVGLISNYTMIINSLGNLLWGMLASIIGSVGQFNVDSDLERKRGIFDELYLCTFWLYSCLCVGLMTLLSSLVFVWLGKEYIIDQHVIVALVSIIYVSGINFPFYSFRVTCGMFNPMKYNYVCSAVLNIILSIALGKKYGLIGIFAATTLSRLVAAEFKEGLLVYQRILERSAWQYFCKYGLSALLMFFVYFLTRNVIGAIAFDGWRGIFIKGVVCLIITNIIYLLVFFKTKTFKRLLQRVLNLICRK